MIKNSRHIRLKHFVACERLIKLIDEKPQVLRGIRITPNEVANDRHLPFRNVSIAGVLLAFFVKVFH